MAASEHLSPQQFFHGTTEEAAQAIEREGLRPGRRGLWYAANSPEFAREFGPVVFALDLTGIEHTARHPGTDAIHVGETAIPPDRLRRHEQA